MRQRVARLAELMSQEWYTAEETSDLLGVSLDLVRRAVASGTLPARTDDAESVQIGHDDLVVWLQRRPYAAWVAEL